jgi:hypothetical protein
MDESKVGQHSREHHQAANENKLQSANQLVNNQNDRSISADNVHKLSQNKDTLSSSMIKACTGKDGSRYDIDAVQ